MEKAQAGDTPEGRNVHEDRDAPEDTIQVTNCLSNLPNEMIWRILFYLEQVDLRNVSMVDRSLNDNVTDFHHSDQSVQSKRAILELRGVIKAWDPCREFLDRNVDYEGPRMGNSLKTLTLKTKDLYGLLNEVIGNVKEITEKGTLSHFTALFLTFNSESLGLASMKEATEETPADQEHLAGSWGSAMLLDRVINWTSAAVFPNEGDVKAEGGRLRLRGILLEIARQNTGKTTLSADDMRAIHNALWEDEEKEDEEKEKEGE